MVYESIRRGGNVRLERGMLERAGIRVNGDVLSGKAGLSDAQERENLQLLLLRRRLEAQELLRRRDREKLR